MKRGLISWDKSVLPPAEFDARLAALHILMDSRGISALVAYSDVWRSNDVRFISNYMPYWNRALTVVPRGEKPILLCALSPRVYPWIKSVTVHETIIASPNLPVQLDKLCTERGWSKIGICDFPSFPADLHEQLQRGKAEIVDIPRSAFRPMPTVSEIKMHGRAAQLARDVLEKEMSSPDRTSDYQLTGRLERSLRRAGAEDVVILVSNGSTPPIPAAGHPVDQNTSAVVALECNGHWSKISRNFAGETTSLPPPVGTPAFLETLSGPYSWEAIENDDPSRSAIVSLQVELKKNGKRLYFGETCLRHDKGLRVL